MPDMAVIIKLSQAVKQAIGNAFKIDWFVTLEKEVLSLWVHSVYKTEKFCLCFFILYLTCSELLLVLYTFILCAFEANVLDLFCYL